MVETFPRKKVENKKELQTLGKTTLKLGYNNLCYNEFTYSEHRVRCNQVRLYYKKLKAH
jgi:hypothetical protein